MQVTVSQTLMFDELPFFLERLGTDIHELLREVQDAYVDADEHFDAERFTAYAHSLEEVRQLLSRVDIKVRELRALSLNYQQALLELENANNAPQEPAPVQAPLEEGGDV